MKRSAFILLALLCLTLSIFAQKAENKPVEKPTVDSATIDLAKATYAAHGGENADRGGNQNDSDFLQG